MAAARKARTRRAPAAADKPKNGHGGARAGAGRPREKLPEDLLAELADPPDDPLKKAEWWSRLLEVLQLGCLRGKPWTTMLRDAQRSATIVVKLVPEEIKHKATLLLEKDEQDLKDESTRVAETPRKADPVAVRSRAVRRDPA